MKIIFLAIFNLLIVKSYEQVIIPESTTPGNNFDYKKHNGIITLNNGDTITGTFLYANLEFPTYNLKYYNNGVLKKRYSFPQIRKVVFEGGDDILTSGDSTVFVKIPGKGKYLYRQLTFGDIKIYDELFLVDEDIGFVSRNLVVVYKDQEYKTETNGELFSLAKKLKPELIGKLKNNSRQEIIRYLNNTICNL